MLAFNRWWSLFIREQVGRNTRAFLKGVCSLGPFYLLARFLTSGTYVLAGRWLGSNEYGLASLAIAGSNILVIPLQLGFAPAVTKFPAMETSHDQQARLISTALWLNLLWGMLCAGLLYAFSGPIGKALRLSQEIYTWSLLVAFLLACQVLICSSLQGVRRFLERGRVEVIYATVFAVTFASCYFVIGSYYVSLIMSLCTALVVSAVTALYYLRTWSRMVISAWAVKAIKSYAVAPVINSIAVVMITSATPIVLSTYMSAREVGIVSVYNLGSVMAAGALSGVVSVVLTPLSSTPTNQDGAWRKFLRVSPLVFLAGVAVFLVTSVLVLTLAGAEYPIRPLWLALFASSAALWLLFAMALTLLYSRDSAGVWLGVGGMFLSGLVGLSGSLWFIPRYAISGAGLALLASYGSGLIWCTFWGWKALRVPLGS